MLSGQQLIFRGAPFIAICVATSVFAEPLKEARVNNVFNEVSVVNQEGARPAQLNELIREEIGLETSEVMRSERLSLVGSMANSILHDLKNPICIVRCCADLIEDQTKDPRVKELTTMIDGAVDGMMAMTQELLDYARGSSSLKKESISMWRFLDELSKQSLRLLPGQNIQFVKHIRYDGNLEIDLSRFTRMMGNLIKNPSEAMQGGGILTLCTDLVQNEVSIRLSDTGCGVPAELLPKLFEPFVTHGKTHGTGLGMAIAKSIVDSHGGKISVTSAEGTGTTVEIRLPVISTPTN